MQKYRQGIYKPKNPLKYKGSYPIVYRSFPEAILFKWFDNNNFILEWSSESIPIPYIKPTDNKIHRYFVDFWVKFKNQQTGEITKYLIEYKPFKQTIPPIESKNKKTSTILHEKLVFVINMAKFKSAREYCEKNNMKFLILTEKDLPTMP